MMLSEKEITSSPTHYAQWLECFEILKKRSVNHDEYKLLCGGICRDSEHSLQYLETELVKTINAMLSQYIHEFQREWNMYAIFGETESLYLPYVHFAQKLSFCLFFRNLKFMSEKFRRELESSVRSEAEKFWLNAYRTLYYSCAQQHDTQLEDVLYQIKRIRLFPENDSQKEDL